jgi:hypothetical protein
MGPLQTHRQLSGQDETDGMASRYEPQSFTPRVCPPDPYTAWLEQREGDREREGFAPVRWIHRPRDIGGPAIRASAVGARDRAGLTVS